MKKIRNMRKRTGFTLVELLIVIIIIGILAGSMMLVAGSGTDRAEATKIISDLRSMKSAALMVYADQGKWPTAVESMDNYMDRDIPNGRFLIASGDTDAPGQYVGRIDLVPNSGVMEALANSATDAGLIGGTNSEPTSADIETTATSVWMILTR